MRYKNCTRRKARHLRKILKSNTDKFPSLLDESSRFDGWLGGGVVKCLEVLASSYVKW